MRVRNSIGNLTDDSSCLHGENSVVSWPLGFKWSCLGGSFDIGPEPWCDDREYGLTGSHQLSTQSLCSLAIWGWSDSFYGIPELPETGRKWKVFHDPTSDVPSTKFHLPNKLGRSYSGDLLPQELTGLTLLCGHIQCIWPLTSVLPMLRLW